MTTRTRDPEQAPRIPVHRAIPLQRALPLPPVPPPARRVTSGAELVPVTPRTVAARAPTTADVALGAAALAVEAARSAVDIATSTGRLVVDRLPVPAFVRSRVRRAWLDTGRAGAQTGAAVRARLGTLLDAVVPQLVREVLSRLDVTRLVGEFVDLDRVAADLDVDAVADRLDLDRVLARVDLNEIADRIDLDRAAARLDLDRIVDRLELDEIVARVDLDRAAARLDLDPILERADIVGLARYVIEAIDLPEIIRSSTGTMTSDVVRGVRAQGADADEAVQRVVDRLLRRRGPRDEAAPGQERR